MAAFFRRAVGEGLDKAGASAAKAALKAKIAPLCSYAEGELTEKDLYDLGTDQLFSASMEELGAGECMA
jgi:hypothetical protein